MRTFGKWLGRTLLVLILIAGALYAWKREEITRVLAVNSLFSADKIVHNFSHMDTIFSLRLCHAGPPQSLHSSLASPSLCQIPTTHG